MSGSSFNGKFRFFSWDGDLAYGQVDTTISDKNNDPAFFLFNTLRQSDDFRLRFADRVHELFFNDGIMSADGASKLFGEVAAIVDRGMRADSAAWRANDIDGYSNYVMVRTASLSQSPTRTETVLNQLRSPNSNQQGFDANVHLPLYPSIEATATEFRIDEQRQHGGSVASGSNLTFDLPLDAELYYMADDAAAIDPRDPTTDEPRPNAQSVNSLAINETTTVFARARVNGEWSASTVATFDVQSEQRMYLRVSELMYNPPAATEIEAGGGAPDNDDFEYIELLNTSETIDVDLTGVSFTDGVNYTFASGVLRPGERIVVAANREVFIDRYGDRGVRLADGDYSPNNLNNGGEVVELSVMDAGGAVVHHLEYSDDNWYPQTDGQGYALVAVDTSLPGDAGQWMDQSGWRRGDTILGSPGSGENVVRGVVYLDADADGLQNLEEEAGLSEIDVVAHYAGIDGDFSTLDDNRTWTAQSDSSGFYFFGGLTPGFYQLEIPGVMLTVKDLEPDPLTASLDRIDSDFYLAEHADAFRTDTFAVREFVGETTFSAGIIMDSTVTHSPAGNVLTINGTAGDDTLAVSAANGVVTLNGTPLAGASAAAVQQINVFGYSGVDTIDLEGVTANLFPAIVTTRAYGGSGDDKLFGSPGADLLHGGSGQDHFKVQGGAAGAPLDKVIDNIMTTVNETPEHGGVSGLENTLEFTANGTVAIELDYGTGETRLRYEYSRDGGESLPLKVTAVDALFEILEGNAAVDPAFNFDHRIDGDPNVPEINDADVTAFVEKALGTRRGDANFDGNVTALDLNRVGIHWQHNDVVSWFDGNFGVGSQVDAADLNEVGVEWQFSNANPAASAAWVSLPEMLDGIAQAAAAGGFDEDFDFNNDGQVTAGLAADSDVIAYLDFLETALNETFLPGDVDVDGDVDAIDFAKIVASYLVPPAVALWSNGDINTDGVVNWTDINLWMSNRSDGYYGDLDNNGAHDAEDIDNLFSAIWIEDEMSYGTYFLGTNYDLNYDGYIDEQDLDYLIHYVLGTEYGDANLDGMVDQLDLDIVNLNWQQTVESWADGDFNGDGFVDVLDLMIVAINFGFGT